MAFDKERQVQAIRIFLTVFYGFFLPSPVFIRGIVFTIEHQDASHGIWLAFYAVLRLILVIFVVYAIWFNKSAALLVSGIILAIIFIAMLVFAIVGFSKFRLEDTDENYFFVRKTDHAGIVQLSVELFVILLATTATFVLVRYIKKKYAPINTQIA